MQRPVQLRHDASDKDELGSFSASSEDDESSNRDSTNSETSDLNSQTERHGYHQSSDDEMNGSVPESEESKADNPSLQGLSFGALAEAQERFQPKSRKRKLPMDFDPDKQEQKTESPAQRTNKQEQSRLKPSRTSKHAPTILSSKQQVSRRRDIFEPSPAVKSRDPRFDPTIQASNHDRNAVEKANKSYSFLSSYQAAEILELKSQIKKSKDPDAIADLKRRVMAVENKVRSVEAKQRERDIVKQHKQKEKELIRTGQKSKPYYLKEGEIKRLATNERLEGMGKKARDKAIQRKQKREKSKEARHMPHVRRE